MLTIPSLTSFAIDKGLIDETNHYQTVAVKAIDKQKEMVSQIVQLSDILSEKEKLIIELKGQNEDLKAKLMSKQQLEQTKDLEVKQLKKMLRAQNGEGRKNPDTNLLQSFESIDGNQNEEISSLKDKVQRYLTMVLERDGMVGDLKESQSALKEQIRALETQMQQYKANKMWTTNLSVEDILLMNQQQNSSKPSYQLIIQENERLNDQLLQSKNEQCILYQQIEQQNAQLLQSNSERIRLNQDLRSLKNEVHSLRLLKLNNQKKMKSQAEIICEVDNLKSQITALEAQNQEFYELNLKLKLQLDSAQLYESDRETPIKQLQDEMLFVKQQLTMTQKQLEMQNLERQQQKLKLETETKENLTLKQRLAKFDRRQSDVAQSRESSRRSVENLAQYQRRTAKLGSGSDAGETARVSASLITSNVPNQNDNSIRTSVETRKGYMERASSLEHDDQQAYSISQSKNNERKSSICSIDENSQNLSESQQSKNIERPQGLKPNKRSSLFQSSPNFSHKLVNASVNPFVQLVSQSPQFYTKQPLFKVVSHFSQKLPNLVENIHCPFSDPNLQVDTEDKVVKQNDTTLSTEGFQSVGSTSIVEQILQAFSGLSVIQKENLVNYFASSTSNNNIMQFQQPEQFKVSQVVVNDEDSSSSYEEEFEVDRQINKQLKLITKRQCGQIMRQQELLINNLKVQQLKIQEENQKLLQQLMLQQSQQNVNKLLYSDKTTSPINLNLSQCSIDLNDSLCRTLHCDIETNQQTDFQISQQLQQDSPRTPILDLVNWLSADDFKNSFLAELNRSLEHLGLVVSHQHHLKSIQSQEESACERLQKALLLIEQLNVQISQFDAEKSSFLEQIAQLKDSLITAQIEARQGQKQVQELGKQIVSMNALKLETAQIVSSNLLKQKPRGCFAVCRNLQED